MRSYDFFKRLFDIITSLVALIILSPLFIIISIIIKLDSHGPVFYWQKRVGKNFREFSIIKFRSMFPDADQQGFLTVGEKDSRVTKAGRFLRRYKLDELPQLLNVLIGEMSIVGPRPEVKKYVALYNVAQKKILNIRPGLTDPASLQFFNENEILAHYQNPEDGYIKEVLPEKLELYVQYLSEKNFFLDMKIILKTIQRIFS